MTSCQCEGLRCKLEALDARHGKRTGYAKHGCRCHACRDAQADYMARYSAANPARTRELRRASYRRKHGGTLPSEQRRAHAEAVVAVAVAERWGTRETARTLDRSPRYVRALNPAVALTPAESADRIGLLRLAA